MSDNTNQISTLLQFAHLQMASEAFFGLKEAEPSWNKVDTTGFNVFLSERNINIEYLTDGNEHASKFSPTQAKQFADNWKIAAHIANTTTGFSGTLFEAKDDIPEAGITKGERVLSFRSTEFIEDAVHDNRSTNTFEIKEKGFAFGQIADMERWVAMLKQEGLLNDPVYVTGYSLGGHLATAFNILHQDENLIKATYTFNGAGVGRQADGSDMTQEKLQQAINDFINWRDNGAAQEFTGSIKILHNGTESVFSLAPIYQQVLRDLDFSSLENTQTQMGEADDWCNINMVYIFT